MQRVTNCVLIHDQSVLMIKKPRRGWWYSPGGKMEAKETILETVKREVREETGLIISSPKLKGVFTILIQQDGEIVDEWMLFTFVADQWEGDLLNGSHEGELAWQSFDQISEIPMAEGDRIVLTQILKGSELLIGRFIYTPDYELISYQLSTEAGEISMIS